MNLTIEPPNTDGVPGSVEHSLHVMACRLEGIEELFGNATKRLSDIAEAARDYANPEYRWAIATYQLMDLFENVGEVVDMAFRLELAHSLVCRMDSLLIESELCWDTAAVDVCRYYVGMLDTLESLPWAEEFPTQSGDWPKRPARLGRHRVAALYVIERSQGQ